MSNDLKAGQTCMDCELLAIWCLSTQFSGDFPFCDKHARAEKTFGKIDWTGGQFVWERLDPETKSWRRAGPDDGFTTIINKME